MKKDNILNILLLLLLIITVIIIIYEKYKYKENFSKQKYNIIDNILAIVFIILIVILIPSTIFLSNKLNFNVKLIN